MYGQRSIPLLVIRVPTSDITCPSINSVPTNKQIQKYRFICGVFSVSSLPCTQMSHANFYKQSLHSKYLVFALELLNLMHESLSFISQHCNKSTKHFVLALFLFTIYVCRQGILIHMFFMSGIIVSFSNGYRKVVSSERREHLREWNCTIHIVWVKTVIISSFGVNINFKRIFLCFVSLFGIPEFSVKLISIFKTKHYVNPDRIFYLWEVSIIRISDSLRNTICFKTQLNLRIKFFRFVSKSSLLNRWLCCWVTCDILLWLWTLWFSSFKMLLNCKFV